MDLTLIQDTNRQFINARKIFWMMVTFEIVLMAVLLLCRFETQMIVTGIVVVPLFIVLIPLEPVIGLAVMVVMTGMDYFGVVASDPSEIYLKLTWFHLVMVLTFISSFTNIIIKKQTTIPSLSVWPPLIVFLTMYCVSLYRTPNMQDALITFVRVVMLSQIILMIVLCIETRWHVFIMVGAIMLASLVISGVTLWQMFSEGSFFAPIVIKMANALGLPVFRSTGTFLNPNGLACYLMNGFILFFALLFMKNIPSLFRWLLFIGMLVVTLGLITSFSRGGWVSSMVAAGLIVIFHRRWSYFAYFAGFIAVSVIVISIRMPNLWQVVFERFGTIFNSEADASSTARISLIKSSIWMWMDYPIFGVGLRGFPFYFQTYIDPSMPHALKELREAHTIQTEILAEFGLVGIIISTWLFVTVFFEGLKRSFTIKNDFLRCAEIGFVSLLIGFLVNFTFATDITNNMFWITIGLIYAIPLVDRNISSEESSEESVPATV